MRYIQYYKILQVIKKGFTSLNSGPNSIEGFEGLFLALFRTKTPSVEEYKSDCRINKGHQQSEE